MATELTWQYLVDYPDSDHSSIANLTKNMAWAFTQFLLGNLPMINQDGSSATGAVTGKWTQGAASDGVGGYGADTTPRGLTKAAYTVGEIVYAAAASNHTHCTLVSPSGMTGGQVRLINDLAVAAGSNVTSLITHGYGAASGGSATAAQTLADGIQPKPNNVFPTWNDGTITGTPCQRMQGAIASDGQFWFCSQKTGNALFPFGIFGRVVTSQKTGDDTRFVLGVNFDSTNGGFAVMPSSGTSMSGTNSIITGHISAGRITGRSNSAKNPVTFGVEFMSSFFAASAVTTPLLTGADIVDGSYQQRPCNLVNLGSTSTGTWKGRLPDFYLVQSDIADGTMSASSTPFYMVSGNLLVPFPVTPTMT